MAPTPDDKRLRVVIAGGGAAAVECVLALRQHAGDRVAITMISPDDDLVYRPLTVAEPFGSGPAPRFPLAAVASDFDVDLVRDKLAWVSPSSHLAFTEGWQGIRYDALVVAIGARRTPAFDHALTVGAPGATAALRSLVHALTAGDVQRAAFLAPGGATWTLPLYELALMAARAAAPGAELTIVSPEVRPLSLFGEEASSEVASLLADAGVAFAGDAIPATPRHGCVEVSPDRPALDADAVVALPRLEGARIRGLPCDEGGFLAVTPFGHVLGAKHVYAAGDGTSFPIKQGGVACQQADVVAEVIARRAGAPVTPTGHKPVLRGMLLTGTGPRYLRHTLGGHGVVPPSEASDHVLWWPPGKIAGAYLSSYLGDTGASTEPEPAIRRRAVISRGRDGGHVELTTLSQPAQ